MKRILCLLVFMLLALLCWADVGQHSVTLTWNEADPTAVSYNIYRGISTGVCVGTPAKYANTGNKNYVDTNVTAGTTYFYAVSALNSAGGESTCSSEVQASVPSAPATPSGLAGVAK